MATGESCKVLFVFCLFVLLGYGLASTIVLTSSDTVIKPPLTTDLSLRCGLENSLTSSLVGRSISDGNSNYDSTGTTHGQGGRVRSVQHTDDIVHQVTSISVSRNGLTIATLDQQTPARAVVVEAGLTVTGQIKSHGVSSEIGYLELQWKHPSMSQAGQYRCDIKTSSSAGNLDFNQTVNINAVDVGFEDLVFYVQNLNLEKELIMERNQLMNNTIQTLINTIDTFNDTVKDLKQENHDMKMSLGALKHTARVEPNVFFTAYLNQSKVVSGQDTLVYDAVYSNEGQGYNTSTGFFRAPVGGFYRFEVNLLRDSEWHAQLNIRVNGTELVSAVTTYATTHKSYESASNSVITKLAQGDRVDVISYGRVSHLFVGNGHYRGNTFSGRLIALV